MDTNNSSDSVDKYEEAFYVGGVYCAFHIAFCELFIANCFMIKVLEDEATPRYWYKITDLIDISLLHKVEQVVASCFKEFKTIYDAYHNYDKGIIFINDTYPHNDVLEAQ